MTQLREAAQQALEALAVAADHYHTYHEHPGSVFQAAITALKAALAEPVQDGKCQFCTDGCPACDARKLPVQEPVAGRAFLERILAAMEGVIDVADRKTDEFDALRSCVIDLTLMLHTAPPRQAEPVRLQCVTCGTVYAEGVPPQVPVQQQAEPVQEPVAWLSRDDARLALWEAINKREFGNPTDDKLILDHLHQQGLWIGKYTAPPQRPPLTEDEVEQLLSKYEHNYDMVNFARAIERAHGIK